MNKNTCPVCGFGMKHPPSDFNICPSCGVEFDADTISFEIRELRQAWIDRGMTWSSRSLKQPVGYDPAGQLEALQALPAATMGDSLLAVTATVLRKPVVSVKDIPTFAASASSNGKLVITLA